LFLSICYLRFFIYLFNYFTVSIFLTIPPSPPPCRIHPPYFHPYPEHKRLLSNSKTDIKPFKISDENQTKNLEKERRMWGEEKRGYKNRTEKGIHRKRNRTKRVWISACRIVGGSRKGCGLVHVE